MKRKLVWALCLVLLVSGSSVSSAQRHRDPLTEEEADQLRDLRQEPLKRLRLIVKFARARLEAAERLRSDPRIPDSGKQIRTLLEDFTNIVDEMDDNLDSYRTEDLRKPLKEIVEADTDFQLRLRTLKQGTPEEKRIEYAFALDSAIDSVNASADTARAMLDDQVAIRGKVKPGEMKDEGEEKDGKKKGHDDDVECPVKPC